MASVLRGRLIALIEPLLERLGYELVELEYVPNRGNALMRIFIDRSVLEVFANDRLCATKVIPALDSNPALEIQSQGGTALIRRVQCWPIKSIW